LWRRYHPDRINIMDPNFSSNAPRVQEIAEALSHADVRVDICCDMRARDVLRLAGHMSLSALRAAGFTEVYIGVESGSDRMLHALRKGLTAAEAYEACALLDQAGIRTITSFMHDLPGETREDSGATLALARRLAALPGNSQRHHFFTPYPSTEIYERIAHKVHAGRGIRQSDWAATSTYLGSPVWPGRADFRRRSIAGLSLLRARLDEPSRITLPGPVQEDAMAD
jgi:radical SAM superfamily enzyme YgiQ (UPF0313 family)